MVNVQHYFGKYVWMDEITVKIVAAGRISWLRWKSQSETFFTWLTDVLKLPIGQKSPPHDEQSLSKGSI